MKTLFDLDYEEIKRNDNDHIATPRWIVEKNIQLNKYTKLQKHLATF